MPSDDVPFGNTSYVDDLNFGGGVWDYTDDEAKESSSITVAPGKHVLKVLGVPANNEKAVIATSDKYTLPNKKIVAVQSKRISVEFLVVDMDNPQVIRDTFIIPPERADQFAAYMTGTPAGKTQAGWQAKKFRHFLGKLGFEFAKNAAPPKIATSIANWAEIGIVAEIEISKPYTDKDGIEHRGGFPKVTAFSYERISPAAASKHRLLVVQGNQIQSALSLSEEGEGDEGYEEEEEDEAPPPPKRKKTLDI